MHTTSTPLPIAIGPDSVIHLGADLDITPIEVTPDFWNHVASDAAAMSEGRLLSVFEYSATWPYWERHPDGDELVYLLTGEVDLLLEDDHQSRTVPLRAGEAAIVPAGSWHRAVFHTPSRLLFVTPTPRRTEQRPAI